MVLFLVEDGRSVFEGEDGELGEMATPHRSRELKLYESAQDSEEA